MTQPKKEFLSDCCNAPITGKAGLGDFHNEEGITMAAICGECGKPCGIAEPKKENWEEEFDEKFVIGSFVYRGDNSLELRYRLNDIKSFISQNFVPKSEHQDCISRERVEEAIERMRKKGNIGTAGNSYNQALSDLKKELLDKETK